MNEYASQTIETRIAYYYLKGNGKIKSYYEYQKGQITRKQLLELIPKEELKTVINKEMSEATIKGIFNAIDDIKEEKGVNQVDVIIGGPPCQAYSLLVGRRAAICLFRWQMIQEMNCTRCMFNFLKNICQECLCLKMWLV